MSRAAGILLSISSLPGEYGIGCFSKSAYDFVDWLKEAGQTYWQILPLGPTSYGDSPYQSFSTFAGNPYYISLEALINEGVLTKEECDAADLGNKPNDISYHKLYDHRYPLLRLAYERSQISENPDYIKFANENDWWLSDYALFMAVKDRFDGKPWTDWAEDIRLRYPNAMDYYRRELYFDIEFQKYLQFKFFEQWHQLKAYANSKGIQIIGDIPIYVAMDSADAWAHPELFQLDEKNVPIAVAGCPPDGFSATGQLWGNPLYAWKVHKEEGFKWWVSRVKALFEMYDVVRIDHFRGFEKFYSIPAKDETAENGKWKTGPGIDLFNAIKAELGDVKIIAEDLGHITAGVRKLLDETGYPGMKIMQFAFTKGVESDYLLHNHIKNCVVYTGTHDNQTAKGWYESLTWEEQNYSGQYMMFYTEVWEKNRFIRHTLSSPANLAIVSLQDYLELGDEARINTPGTAVNNWKWRLTPEQFDDETCRYMAYVTELYYRK